jgi:hypothetical protein
MLVAGSGRWRPTGFVEPRTTPSSRCDRLCGRQGIAGSTHWLPGGAGIVYNAQMLETIAREIASAIGWRATAPNAR